MRDQYFTIGVAIACGIMKKEETIDKEKPTVTLEKIVVKQTTWTRQR